MPRWVLPLLFALLLPSAFAAEAPQAASARVARVVVIPVREQIGRPILYILRRGLKEAVEEKADVVVLDLKTPGGALDVTLEIMEALEKFPGKKIAFVDNEAMSAGAFIAAVTDEIWFAPDGIIGAAAPVTSTGQDVDKTMKLKLTSYLKARMRAISEGHGFRGQVISAMIDEESELKLDGTTLKEKGELLSLTAKEASQTYGKPAQPLLASGIARDIDDLLAQKFGRTAYTTKALRITWSEDVAVFLNGLSPILVGLGLLALFIEFKTPGFGFFGIAGIALLAVVFLGNFVAGFSGHEPLLAFAVGLVLLAAEVFFFPGVMVLALGGLVLMFGSLVWSMIDLWPNQPLSLSSDLLLQPLLNVGLGVLVAVVLAALLVRFLPRGWWWNRLVLESAVSANSQENVHAELRATDIVGRRGKAVTSLRPAGQVEIDGRRYEARVEVGAIDVGEAVVVTRRTDFALMVERA